jgi:putative copper export protein
MVGFVAAEIVMGSCVLILSAVLTALPAPVP